MPVVSAVEHTSFQLTPRSGITRKFAYGKALLWSLTGEKSADYPKQLAVNGLRNILVSFECGEKYE